MYALARQALFGVAKNGRKMTILTKF